MIEVNLLPQEYRRREMTPLPRLITIVVGVIIVVGGFFFLMQKYLDIRNAKDLRGERQEEVKRAEKIIEEFNRLSAEINEIKVRITAIEDIWQSRLEWAVKLDQLTDVVPSYVGLTDLSLVEARGRPRPGAFATAGTLKMKCISASDNEKRLANFLRTLKGEIRSENSDVPEEVSKKFSEDFVEVIDSGWNKQESDDYVEKEYLEFNLELPVKVSGSRAK